MSGDARYHFVDAIRVKVKKCEGLAAPEYRRFSVDPQITSFEVLQSLLARAFDMKGDFSISYLAQDEEGRDTYLSLLSDWDLEAAFMGFSEPCLQLKVDTKPFEEGLEDLELVAPLNVTQSSNSGFLSDRSSITGALRNQMEKTINLMQRAFNFGDSDSIMDNFKAIKPPMIDSEFHNYLDSEGCLIKQKELRLSVYQGGIDPSLRKVVWKHILNVYPCGLTAKQRILYMKQRTCEYVKLRETWQVLVSSGNVTEEIHFITNMVRKDVLRTDRTHEFYAGSDDNKNVLALFNILITYALNHPSVSYCQGMSDLASPILVTMKDEAHAYVCFCALMKRLKPNFQLDGEAMSLNFQHLSELLQHYDSQFFAYLKSQVADDLLFCYRWLLLELKREFAFDDALLMLEVLWSSIPPSPPNSEVSLYEELFAYNSENLRSPRFNSRENPYTKVRAIRKQNSASSIRGLISGGSSKEKEEKEIQSPVEEENSHTITDPDNNSVPESSDNCFQYPDSAPSPCTESKNSLTETSNEDPQDYLPMTTSMTRELRIELENLNRQIPGPLLQRSSSVDFDDLDSPDCCHSSYEQSLEVEASETLSERNETIKLCATKKDIKNTSPENRIQTSEDANFENSTAQNTLNSDKQSLSKELPCNGEVFKNDESGRVESTCHLKGVIPIEVVHSSSMNSQLQNSMDKAEKKEVKLPSCLNQRECMLELSKEPLLQNAKLFMKNVCSSLEESNRKKIITNSCEEALEYSGKTTKCVLPAPYELGGGNPFMLFLCLTLLLQHREIIMKNHMDYNELAMHFDKMVRKHNVHKVLHQARSLFREYLQLEWQGKKWGTDPHV